MKINPKRKTLNFGYSKIDKKDSKIDFEREDTENDLRPIIIKSQQHIEGSWIKRNILCIKDRVQMGNEEVETINNYMIPVGIITGLLMFTKGLLTGGLSIFGLGLQFFYFTILSYAAVADKRGDWISRFIPSISGLFLCVSQIIGIFIINGPFTCDDFKSCL